ncbi:MAG: S41 family peptidase [Clostridiales bacterium]|nr:S41 family peptidase [Clostridiales bacterium]
MELRKQKKLAKQKRKAMMKTVLALFLIFLFLLMAISPIIFAEGVQVVSDKEISLQTISTDNGTTTSDEDYKAYLDFMMETIKDSYYKDVDTQSLIEGAYKGIFDALDPYSTYFTPAEYEDFNTSIEGEFGGIGASITEGKNGYVEVVAPLKGTPAEKAGLLPGDMITKINGEDAAGFTTEKAVTLIRGEIGTSVTLEITRPGSAEPFDVTIVRALIIVKSVEFEILENGMGYIKLSDFSQKTNSEFDAAMAHMVNNNVKKLIVDVRNNPGGLLNTAIYVSDYFVPKGKEIVSIDYKGTNDRTYRASREKAPLDVAVLINGGSASASEIFAGSIQQTDSGIIIGEDSYGKGTVQSILPLNNGGGLKVTIAEYKLAGDYKVDTVGIIPDISVESLRNTDMTTFAPLYPERGITSLNVYAAQQRLAALGYDIEADGSFGPISMMVVKKFQADQGIAVTGALDRNTIETLNSAVIKGSTGRDDVQLMKAIEALK